MNIHRFKNPSKAKAIILIDERISSTGESNGGTGKSLLISSLKYFRNVLVQSAGSLRGSDKFVFQGVRENTDIVFYDETPQKFSLSNFYSPITTDLIVEEKNKPQRIIPFKDSPKFVFATNSIIKGLGESDKRRMYILDLSDHYNADHTPYDEFGHRLFDDWDDKEWNLFFNVMFLSMQHYLKDGLVEYERKNLKLLKLRAETCDEFVENVEDVLRYNVELDKKDVFNKYKEQTGNNDIRQNTFTKYLKKFCLINEYEYSVRKSNGVQYFTIIANREKESSLNLNNSNFENVIKDSVKYPHHNKSEVGKRVIK